MSRLTDMVAIELTKIAVDRGKLIEVGWIGMLRHVVPEEASEVQVSEMRKAFYMGAEHVWTSILCALDQDVEPTADDMQRMERIAAELEAFKMEVTSPHAAPRRSQ